MLMMPKQVIPSFHSDIINWHLLSFLLHQSGQNFINFIDFYEESTVRFIDFYQLSGFNFVDFCSLSFSNFKFQFIFIFLVSRWKLPH